MPSGSPLVCGRRTYLMGVLNVTPDSFSGDGRFGSVDAAVLAGEQLVADGADLLDVGGESTRPGHAPVSAEEELERVIPVVQALSTRVSAPISVDTSKATVARNAIAAGAGIINDVSGLRDPDMVRVAAITGASLVLVHHGGADRREDLMSVVLAALRNRVETALRSGVQHGHLVVDPGFGFGKNWLDNFELIRRLSELRQLGLPVLVGPSRKGMIGKVLGTEPEDRLEGTIALTALCISAGADIIRVHDVGELRRAVVLLDALSRR